MTFVSYAQNYEDVMLQRALKDVACGFYIDVGANDPETDSVTKAFYDRGWRGINIEPVPTFFQKLNEERPRDINLNFAASANFESSTFYEIPETGLSTFNKDIAEDHKRQHGFDFTIYEVDAKPLTKICEEYHIAPIHFLKIDVEGGEGQVLEGLDFSKIRPWIILVESTIPLSQSENYSEWEHYLLESEYTFVYFDGLNRFYVANEKSNLAKAFRSPPNVFDQFVTARLMSAEAAAESAVRESEEFKAAMFAAKREEKVLRDKMGLANARLIELQAQCEAEISSRKSAEATIDQLMEKLLENFRKIRHLEEGRYDSDCSSADLGPDMEQRNELTQKVERLMDELDQKQRYIEDILASTSWKISSPVRKIKSLVVTLLHFSRAIVRLSSRYFALFVMRQLLRFPPLFSRINKLIRRVSPRAHVHLRRLAMFRLNYSSNRSSFEYAEEPLINSYYGEHLRLLTKDEGASMNELVSLINIAQKRNSF